MLRQGAELPVASVAQAGDDVALLVEMTVHGAEENRHVGMILLQLANPFRSGEQADEADAAHPPGFEDVERCHAEVRKFLHAMPPIEWLCSGHGPAVTKDVKKKLLALGPEKAG